MAGCTVHLPDTNLFQSAGMCETSFGMVKGHLGVSKYRGTPKSFILIGLSIINHPFWGSPIFGNIQMNLIISAVLQEH